MTNASMRKAIYPGTFDPVTNGHLDLIERGAALFDELIVAVANNLEKTPLFTVEERMGMIEGLVGDFPNVTVDSFRGLAVDYVRKRGYAVILRGLRTISDFEYEYQMALTNRSFANDVETVFVMPSQKYAFISSRLIKEAVALGGRVQEFVPKSVETQLRAKLVSAGD